MKGVARAFDENYNSNLTNVSHVLIKWSEWRLLGTLPTIKLQTVLKRALGMTETLDFEHRMYCKYS